MHSHVLGDQMHHLRLPEIRARDVLTRVIDAFILPGLPSVNVGAPLSKALAIMEQEDTTYSFILDGEEYHGAISIMSLAEHILTLSAQP